MKPIRDDRDSRPALAAFGRRLTELRGRAEASEAGGFAACVQEAGLRPKTVLTWCRGVSAPQRASTPNVRGLVKSLRGRAGEPAEFDAGWEQALEAAQRETDGRRGISSRQARVRNLSGEALQHYKSGLRTMYDFATEPAVDAPSYLWWQAPQWAGKTTLLKNFVEQPPEGVDLVHYFVSGAEGNNRHDRFVTDMVNRLTRRPRTRGPAPTPADLQRLYHRAATRQRRLLIVVDGLDEDAAWDDGPPGTRRSSPSIASLLPQLARNSMVRVIVSSRPTAKPPSDVPASHPLRKRRYVRELPPFVGEQGARLAAHKELERLGASSPGCTATGLLTVIGLLTVAGTGLRARELAELAGVEQDEIDQLLKSSRSLQLVTDAVRVGTDGQVTGHEALLRVAGELLDPALLEDCAGRLHAWADRWRTRGWPESTPDYLLSHYPRLLRGTGRVERIVLDPRRQSRLVAAGRPDEALAQLDLVPVAGQEVTGQEVTGTVAEVALSRTVLSGRTRLVPRDFPGLFALAGQARRARELASSPPDGTAAALRLADVAVVLGRQGREEAEEVGREAAARAERALALPAGRGRGATGLVEAGIALCACGQYPSGHAMLRVVAGFPDAGWADRVRAMKALGGEDRAGLLDGTAEHAEALSLGTSDEQAEALGIWSCLARDDTRFQDRIESFCAELDPSSDLTHVDLLAAGADALLPTRPDTAGALARQAHQALVDAFVAPKARSSADRAHLRLELSTTLARVVAVLRDTGHEDGARGLLGLVPAELHLDVLDEDVRSPALAVLEQEGDSCPAEPRADPDEFDEIRVALEEKPVVGRRLLAAAFARWEGHTSVADTHRWGLPLAESLATAGFTDEAVRLAKRSREPDELAGALAVVSLGCAAGGDVAGAERLARDAARAAVLTNDLSVHGLVAQALARAGEADTAEQRLAARPAPATAAGRRGAERARLAVAAGTAPYDPRAAHRFVEEHAAGLGRSAALPFLRGQTALPDLVDLLLVLPDPREHGADMCAALRSACARPEDPLDGWKAHTVLLNILLGSGRCCPGVPPMAEGRLSSWKSYALRTLLPRGELPVAEWALLHAFLEGAPAARDAAGRARNPEERAAALAAVAGYLAGVRVVVPAADGWVPQRTSVLRFLALADALGTDASRDEEAAHGLVREVLAGEHWRYALPLLPRLAPEVLPRLAELALAHTSGDAREGF
ncbi:hypothetical protein [Streptomyces sp. ML-6]|uniref:hypothetical protein n=1 Tax=Streptomyces sp. ML-6 TaxID=2982693 RepID=UPI0024C09019|nr:hypothetical protein [Streptomyces sp. ML-6]MDK0519525.1 hypothetical protein [Streptomyces sp. ML-6]